MSAREQRAEHRGSADDDRVEARRRELGVSLQGAEHRVEGRRHREQELGVGQEGEVLVRLGAGIGAVGRDRPVSARDERGNTHHELIGEHALAGTDAGLAREVGQPGPEAGPRVHDGLRNARRAGREDDQRVLTAFGDRGGGLADAGIQPPQPDRSARHAGQPPAGEDVLGIRDQSGVRREFQPAPAGERSQRAGRGEVEQRLRSDPARSRERRPCPEQRLARPRIGEHHRPARVHDRQGKQQGIQAGTHREQHPVALREPPVAQSLREGPDPPGQLLVREGLPAEGHRRVQRVRLGRREHGRQQVGHLSSTSDAYDGRSTPRAGRRDTTRSDGCSSSASSDSRICAIASGAPMQ